MENLSRHAVSGGVCFMLLFQAQLSHLLMSFFWEEWLTGAVRAGRSPLTLTFRTLAVNHRDGVIECIALNVLIQRNWDSVTYFTFESSHKRSLLLIAQVIRVVLQDKMLSLTPRENKVIETIWLPGVGHGQGWCHRGGEALHFEVDVDLPWQLDRCQITIT